MADMCGDNRFEIISKAKADLLEGTNIETDEAEMAVLDNILFRCWQMGWLDRYDTADTPQTEEFKNFDREALILLIECQKERIGELLADKDAPQTDCPWK